MIPCLLIKDDGLVKTVRFRQAKYVGDPINAVKLFNDLEVDELFLMDITATPHGREPDFRLLRKIAGEAFMPMGYGGGVRTVEHARQLLQLGMEKVVVTSAALEKPEFISELASEFGSQSIVVGLDVKHNWLGLARLRTHGGKKGTGRAPADFAREAQERGAGELLLNSIDRDGTRNGYDLDMIRRVCNAVTIPVVACGGAGSLADLRSAIRAGASAAAAGSFFVFTMPHHAVLINYPSQDELVTLLGESISE